MAHSHEQHDDVIDLGIASVETHGPDVGQTDEILGRQPAGLSKD